MTGTQETASFRLAYVPGVTPGKWVRTWSERVPDVPLDLVAVSAAEADRTLREGGADVGLVRLPIARTGLHAIPLYEETSVIVVPKDHEMAAVEEVSVGDLDEYVLLHPLDDCLDWPALPGQPARERPDTTADAVELVAAGVGLLVVPQSLARLHHRRDLTYRPLTGAPSSQVALSWLEEQTTELVEEFIGIVRGRTVNSSRGRGAATAPAAARRPEKGADKGKQGGAGAARKKAAPAKSAKRGGGKPKRRG
ncbi:LysR family substrate-binding domain-containing protein [Actinospica durhamensis]|uniref:LysR family substrate-binding domain-containing protein n=1 Tax=Actinospica durhamensis TaxID=1508375 RepID=A0A941IU02_9ACTN|nr:LysR family substrate-binding domain-containing protein [Actinospica durhamensis]MBR7836683.1 LysR family substrate-binding domain-containing protein [Actinospica durhamensis]